MPESFKSSKQEHLSHIKKEFYQKLKQYKEEFKPTKELTTYSTLPLLTSSNYPDISTYQVTNSSIENTQEKQNEFVKKDYSHILQHKAQSIVATSKPTSKSTRNNIHEELQSIYSSKKPIESEHQFENELKIGSILSSKTAGLLGNSSQLLSITTHDNVSISKHIEKHQTGETKAKEAVIELYERGFNDTQIRSLLSLSTFGLENNKTLVPTKWSISACDSIIEQHLYAQIIKFPVANTYELFEYYDKGNHFIILMLPYPFCSEVIETYTTANNQTIIEDDFVQFNNKLKTKEPECAGGYYATKLGILEYMKKQRKQYACISIRLIQNYEIPLGVIFVREGIREALKSGHKITTQSYQELIEYLSHNYSRHYIHFMSSKLNREIKTTKYLNEFF